MNDNVKSVTWLVIWAILVIVMSLFISALIFTPCYFHCNVLSAILGRYFVMLVCFILLLGLFKLAQILGFYIPPFYYPKEKEE